MRRRRKQEYTNKTKHTNGILLDTSYLLPILGIKVNLEDYDETFPLLLARFNVFYNPVSLVEAKWIALKRYRKTGNTRILKRFSEGVESIILDDRLKETILTNSLIEETSDKLLVEKNVRDYFDRIIYATAAAHRLTLLTEDENLHKTSLTQQEMNPPKKTSWNQIKTHLKNT